MGDDEAMTRDRLNGVNTNMLTAIIRLIATHKVDSDGADRRLLSTEALHFEESSRENE